MFFYGTLMSGFKREGRARLDTMLAMQGRGHIDAALYDLGIYPGAIPAGDSKVWGEVHRMLNPEAVLTTLDEIEGVRPGQPDASLYRREQTAVTLSDGRQVNAWAYFYNAPLGRADGHR